MAERNSSLRPVARALLTGQFSGCTGCQLLLDVAMVLS